MQDFRSFVQLLEEQGELVRISREVDPEYEQAAVMQHLDQERRGFLFEQVRGARYAAVGGLLNTLPRLFLQDKPVPHSDQRLCESFDPRRLQAG